jgi:predicted HTH domain antitoxin
MSVVIPDDILEAARLTPGELKLEIAVLLFRRGGLTLAQASRFGEMDRAAFQHVLASRQIPVNYDVPEFEADLGTLDQLKQ